MKATMTEASSCISAPSAAPLPTEAPWQKLDGLDPLAGTFPARARVDGEGILIFRTKTGFRGVQRSCPHLNATLMDADLVGNDTMIRCRQHVFTFRLSDGRGVNCPGFSVRVFDVKVEAGALYARRAR
jgi:nitrite reductase/ring-hydroxylating ferredoxin subunit